MECILCFEAWLDQPTYWEIGDATGEAERAEAAIASMMRLVVKFLSQQKGSGKQRGNGCWKVLKFIAQIHDAGLADQTAAFPRQSIVVLVPEHRSHRQILGSQQHPPLSRTINSNRITTLRPKIMPTLSTIQAKWQEEHTTPAVSDRKVVAHLQSQIGRG
jgi:hypothetical protein